MSVICRTKLLLFAGDRVLTVLRMWHGLFSEPVFFFLDNSGTNMSINNLSELHGPSMLAIAKIYGVHYIQSSFYRF